MTSIVNGTGKLGAIGPGTDLPGTRGRKPKGARAMTGAERERKRYRSMSAELKRELEAEKRVRENSGREFIGWDGEGINVDGAGKPQAYVLFGASTGDYLIQRNGGTIAFGDAAELILRVGRENPGAWHIGFAFDYDVNQIVKTLPFRYLEWLNEKGSVKFGPYRIEWRKGKSFRVSKTLDGVTQSVIIYDVFSFFATSFVKALQSIFASDNRYSEQVAFVAAGKKRRKEFTLGDLDAEIVPYWETELYLLSALGTQFRDLLYSAGFTITQWYGPGAVASLVLNRNNIRSAMAIPPTEVLECAQYAYAGGRFEQFRVGRISQPIWSCDINSAYPNALRFLPFLAGGQWVYQDINRSFTDIPRESIHAFAVYNVELSHPEWRKPFHPDTPPGPLFFRTEDGEMRYPWHVKGWYWNPEVENLCHSRIAPYAWCYGAWIFMPTTSEKPFAFIADMFEQRREWKRSGRPEQLALKLGMNSIYGKLAQRIGWEYKGTAPTYHQLEWAGWITSYVRAELFRVLWSMGLDIVAVETDGVYVTGDPSRIGIVASQELGGWDVKQYDEILYLQSGTYFARSGDDWISKYRGLDPESLDRERATDYLRSIVGHSPFPTLKGYTTRFIGLPSAMVRSGGNPYAFRNIHAVWEQDKDRDIAPGTGKRVHFPDSCLECAKGISPYDYGHYMTVGLDWSPDRSNHSAKHFLPWKDQKDYEWRNQNKHEQGLLF